MPSFGQWQYSSDPATTREAYAQAKCGYTGRCTCDYCKNFVAVRDRVFPREFADLLSDLGIDASKDGEVYHEGKLAPNAHCYGGWFHFVGSLDETGDFAPVQYPGGFIAYMCKRSAPSLPELDGLPLVQLEFRMEGVPWAIAITEPD